LSVTGLLTFDVTVARASLYFRRSSGKAVRVWVATLRDEPREEETGSTSRLFAGDSSPPVKQLIATPAAMPAYHARPLSSSENIWHVVDEQNNNARRRRQ
jgi:hypothetical protein